MNMNHVTKGIKWSLRRYVPVNGKGWPRKLTPNETKLSGLGQQLMDKEVDLSITVLAWSLERAEKLSFLPPILPRK